MQLREFQNAIEGALTEPMDVPALKRVRVVLRSPEEKKWLRPWIPNRYEVDDIEGIQVAWDRAASAIATLLDAPSPSLRRLAAVMLQYCPSSKTIPSLLSALDDDDVELQMHLLNALAETRDPEIVPPILPLADHDYASVRIAVYAAVGRVGRSRDDAFLIQRLAAEPAPLGRYWILRALGEIGGPRAQATMIEWMGSRTLHPMVWTGLRPSFVQLGDTARVELEALSESEDPVVRTRSIEAVTFFVHPSVHTFLKDRIRTEDLYAVLAAAWGLKMLEDEAGDAVLRHLLDHPDPQIHVAAGCRLASLGDEKGLEILLEHYFATAHRDVVLWTITTLPVVYQSMVNGFRNHASPMVVRAVCDLLAVAGQSEEIGWMTSLLRHADLSLRVTAAISLTTLGQQEGIAALKEIRASLDEAGHEALAAIAKELRQPLPEAVQATLG